MASKVWGHIRMVLTMHANAVAEVIHQELDFVIQLSWAFMNLRTVWCLLPKSCHLQKIDESDRTIVFFKTKWQEF